MTSLATAPSSERRKEEGTLRLQWPLGGTLAQALLLLAAVFAALELLARSPFLERYLPPPSVGSGDVQFELKLERLRLFAERKGAPDCLLVGDSTVLRGINPRAFAEEISDRAEEPPTCFNFGLSGVRLYETGLVADILAHEYHPQLIIVGINISDLAPNTDSSAEEAIVEIPWTQYRLGHYSFAGWLTDTSYTYRYFLALSALQREAGRQEELEKQSVRMRNNGFAPRNYQISPADSPPGLTVPYNTPIEITYDEQEGLDHLAALRLQGIRVILVEMPLLPSYVGTFSDAHEEYRQLLARFAESQGIPFVHSPAAGLIPDEGWADHRHLNRVGAEVFSKWLGREISSAVR